MLIKKLIDIYVSCPPGYDAVRTIFIVIKLRVRIDDRQDNLTNIAFLFIVS